jgi:PHD/YefM family antitoxin component YafN of YafNO toxin-antitoxin module
LSKEEEIVVTNNGKPTALLMNITENNFEETLRLVRQTKLLRAINDAREEAAERGFLREDEIEAEISAYRKEKRGNAI